MSVLVHGPCMAGDFEFSVCELSDKDIAHVAKTFSEDTNLNGLKVLPVFQRSVNDLVGIGPAIEAEKDELLERFHEWAMEIRRRLMLHGYWMELIDPCSGLPAGVETQGQVYSDAWGAETLLKYDTLSAGCCRIIHHPKWGTNVYPSTVFTNAPVDAILASIQQ